MAQRVVYTTEFDIKERDPVTYMGGNVSREDGGCAMIVDEAYVDEEKNGDGCMFVKLQSWDDDKHHPILSTLVGKRVRVVVEVLD